MEGVPWIIGVLLLVWLYIAKATYYATMPFRFAWTIAKGFAVYLRDLFR